MSTHSTINNSVSKQQYSFSKGKRFEAPKLLTHISSYDPVKSQFDIKKQQGNGRGFFQSADRFCYYNKNTKNLPSPGSYGLGDMFGSNSPQPNQRYSFGVGRGNMKKIFVDDILRKSDHSSPGAGTYQPPKSFGKEGANYSMASLLNENE